MVRMPMSDQYPPNITAFSTCLNDCIKIGYIANRRVNNRCTFYSTTKNNRIRSWPRHNRGIWGQNDIVSFLHEKIPLYERLMAYYERVMCSGTSQALPLS